MAVAAQVEQLSDEQALYFKNQVNEQQGFTYSEAFGMGPKCVLFFTAPNGVESGFKLPVRSNSQWLSDATQFKTVVGEAVDYMVTNFR